MRLVLFVLFTVLFSFLVVASPASEADDCGNNLRCVYRVVAETESVDACSGLEEDQQAACYGFLEAQDPEVSVKEQLKEKKPELRKSLILSFSIIIVLVMIIILYLLYQRKKLENE